MLFLVWSVSLNGSILNEKMSKTIQNLMILLRVHINEKFEQTFFYCSYLVNSFFENGIRIKQNLIFSSPKTMSEKTKSLECYLYFIAMKRLNSYFMIRKSITSYYRRSHQYTTKTTKEPHVYEFKTRHL